MKRTDRRMRVDSYEPRWRQPPNITPDPGPKPVPEDWAYSHGRSLRLRVQRVHEDLAHCYPDRVWVEGWVLGPGHEARGWKTALVEVSVLRREADAARGRAR